jgi:hypothetical protein
MRSTDLLLGALLAGAIASPLATDDGARLETALDFAQEKLPQGWSIRGQRSNDWKVADGELRGIGDGALQFAGPIAADFTLSFHAWSAEKTNFEVKVFDLATGKETYTFAFLGRYHSVLEGVKCCILREQNFVAIDPKSWIFPGRKFTLEVRAAKGQLQMFIDGALGPIFVDPQPLRPEKGVRIEILASTEGSKDAVVLDDVRLVAGAR